VSGALFEKFTVSSEIYLYNYGKTIVGYLFLGVSNSFYVEIEEDYMSAVKMEIRSNQRKNDTLGEIYYEP
jgi:hypothetical protein